MDLVSTLKVLKRSIFKISPEVNCHPQEKWVKFRKVQNTRCKILSLFEVFRELIICLAILDLLKLEANKREWPPQEESRFLMGNRIRGCHTNNSKLPDWTWTRAARMHSAFGRQQIFSYHLQSNVWGPKLAVKSPRHHTKWPKICSIVRRNSKNLSKISL
jgi:hypothetical protein